MKILSFLFNAVKFVIKGLFTLLALGVLLGLIGYVLSETNLIIGIIFMIILGLLIGYFAVNIKFKMDKKKRESKIDEKLEKQRFQVKMKDIKQSIELSALSSPEDKQQQVNEVKKVTIKKVQLPRSKVKVKKATKKAKRKAK